MRLFKNRDEAARDLAEKLQYVKSERPIVLGLANGGVPVGMVIAEALDAPLDVLILERLHAPGMPDSPDHIVGAVDEHGRISMIHSAARWHHLTSQEMVGYAREVFRDLEAKRAAVRELMPELDIRDRTVIICDEGIASGARILGAVQSARDRGAKKIIVAAPAGTTKATWQLHETANTVVIPRTPAKYRGIEHFFSEYTPVRDAVMVGMVQRWIESHPRENAVVLTITSQAQNTLGHRLICEMDLPPAIKQGGGPYPAVIFAHGLDSDGRSPRSTPISQRLAKREMIGVRPDLTGHGRSGGSLEDATDEQVIADIEVFREQLERMREVDSHRIGLVAAGDCTAAAIEIAANCDRIRALILRGPVVGGDLMDIERITCPTLIIHGENDTALEEIVNHLDEQFTCKHRVLRIPESSRMFNDPISRELMINASVEWMSNYLASNVPPSEDHPATQKPQSDTAST